MFLSLSKLIPLACLTSPALYGIVAVKDLTVNLLMGLRKPCDYATAVGSCGISSRTGRRVLQFQIEYKYPHTLTCQVSSNLKIESGDLDFFLFLILNKRAQV